MKRVILVAGKARSGKDTTAKIIKEMIVQGLEVEIFSFASPMKEIISDTFSISLNELDSLKNAQEGIEFGFYVDRLEREHHTTFRTLLQRFGTEAMKRQFGDNVWVELMHRKIKESRADVIIIPDWRFKTESEYLLNFDDEFKVITCEVKREGLVNKSKHQSEIDLEDVDKDYVIHNDGQCLSSIEHWVDFMLTQEGLVYTPNYENNYLYDKFKVQGDYK